MQKLIFYVFFLLKRSRKNVEFMFVIFSNSNCSCLCVSTTTLIMNPSSSAVVAPSTSSAPSASNSNRKRKADSSIIAIVVDGEPNSSYAAHVLKYIQSRMSGTAMRPLRFPFIHDVNSYEKTMKIGQGTFGYVSTFFLLTDHFREVFKAKCKRSSRYVALKKILMDNEREGVGV